MKKYDAIILGPGIAGLGVASALARDGKKVLVLGIRGLKGDSSPAAAGILDPLLEMKPRSPFLPFCLAAFRGWKRELAALEKRSGKKTDYHEPGMLYIALDREEEKILRARYQWQKKSGIPVRWCERKWILEREPEVTLRAFSGLFYPTVGRIQPEKLLAAMKKDAEKHGVEFLYLKKSAALKLKSGRVAGVSAGKVFFPAPVVINATGSWAGIHQNLGVRPPVEPAKGQILVVRRGRLNIHSILHTLDGGYIVPWDRDNLLLGSTVEKVGFKPEVTSAGLGAIRQKTEKLVPALRACGKITAWAGLRPFPRDRFPLIGPSKIPGLFLAAGFYRSGILIGNHAGKLLAKGILSGKMPAALKPFDPRRFK